jgi:hypothetical protein
MKDNRKLKRRKDNDHMTSYCTDRVDLLILE